MKQACKIVLMKLKKTENETLWWTNHTGKKNIWCKRDLEILLLDENYYGGRTGGCNRGHKKQQFLFLISTLVAIRQCIVLEQSKYSSVSLCWTGCRPQNTHWRRPTSDPKAFFWLLAVDPLVGQPEPLQLLGDHVDVSLDQHHLSTVRNPSLKPSFTCAS